MTRPDDDPKGYYARLGVAAWATQVAIDAAFRARAYELDPARNTAPDVAERHRAVVEAHGVLSDEARRRAYDAASLGAVEGVAVEVPWFRQAPVLVGISASAVVVLILAVMIRAPESVPSSPARALTPPTI